MKNKIKSLFHSKHFLIAFVIILLALISLAVSIYIIMKSNNNQTIKEIKKNYSSYVTVTRNTKLYDKKGNVLGKIKKGVELELKKVKVNSINNKYLQIADSKYYIYYKDIKKLKNMNTNLSSNILVYNSNVITKKKTILYSNGKEAITLNKGVNFPIQYMDDEYYYVLFGNIYQIKKNSGEKVSEHENTKSSEAGHVSVIHYKTIEDNCSETLCATVNSVKEQLNYLRDNGYSSITLQEYELFIEGKARLKDRSILLTSDTNNERLNNINNEYDLKIQLTTNTTLKFNNSNDKSIKGTSRDSADRYLIKNITTMDNFKKMVNGENVVEKVYVQPRAQEQGIAVLNYHFFHDAGAGEVCNESICLDTAKFRQQLQYLKDNGYKTLKMEEFKQWMYGEIELPQKSVLLTIDDGAQGTGKHNGNKLIPLLEEYGLNATLFLISGWWSADNYRSPNLDIQSHTYDMHQYGTCGRGQVVCSTHDQLLADLQKSLQIVDNNDSFCFPFYSYSDSSLKTVQEAGFKMAFVGGNVKAKRSNNKFLIPRYVIYDSITMNQFINMIS